jgi:hypothetical protein
MMKMRRRRRAQELIKGAIGRIARVHLTNRKNFSRDGFLNHELWESQVGVIRSEIQ